MKVASIDEKKQNKNKTKIKKQEKNAANENYDSYSNHMFYPHPPSPFLWVNKGRFPA